MGTVTFYRDKKKLEVLEALSKIEPTNPIYLSASVSYNAPVDQADAKVEALEKQGYLVVNTYGNDWDCGQILRYALGDDQDEVVEQHVNHLMSCAWGRAVHSGQDFLIVDNNNVYTSKNYDWGKYSYASV